MKNCLNWERISSDIIRDALFFIPESGEFMNDDPHPNIFVLVNDDKCYLLMRP